MSNKWTIAGQIQRLVEDLGGVPICDDCITDRLDLSVRSQANAVTRVIGKEGVFTRAKCRCGSCTREKVAIWMRN